MAFDQLKIQRIVDLAKTYGATQLILFGSMAKTPQTARDNPDGSKTPLTMPNHTKIKSSTLRTICTQTGISRDDFMKAYEKA